MQCMIKIIWQVIYCQMLISNHAYMYIVGPTDSCFVFVCLCHYIFPSRLMASTTSCQIEFCAPFWSFGKAVAEIMNIYGIHAVAVITPKPRFLTSFACKDSVWMTTHSGLYWVCRTVDCHSEIVNDKVISSSVSCRGVISLCQGTRTME